MIEVLSETLPVAIKEYNCMACDFIKNDGISGFGYTFSELRVIAKANRARARAQPVKNLQGAQSWNIRVQPMERGRMSLLSLIGYGAGAQILGLRVVRCRPNTTMVYSRTYRPCFSGRYLPG